VIIRKFSIENRNIVSPTIMSRPPIWVDIFLCFGMSRSIMELMKGYCAVIVI
jgi:hypothetical protein